MFGEGSNAHATGSVGRGVTYLDVNEKAQDRLKMG